MHSRLTLRLLPVTLVLLVPLYALVFVPVAFVLRLLGLDPLRSEPARQSLGLRGATMTTM